LLEKKMWANFDLLLVLNVLALVVVGILMIGNATGNPDAAVSDGWLQVIASMNKTSVLSTMLWFVVGVAAASLLIIFDYHSFGNVSMFIYWAANIMLAVVLVLGKTINGTQGWLMKGSIQPSELAKLTLIIVLAKWLSRKPEGIRKVSDLLLTLLLVAVPLVLIVLQPDYGTAFVYLFITLVMLFVSGTDWKLLLGMFGICGAAGYPLWLILPQTQKNRILALVAPETIDPSKLYNVKQSVTAIGSGQLTGRGFFAPGSFCQLNYVPEKQTDFIFSVTGEAWGFVGCVIILALYAFLLIRLLMLSRRSFDRFGSYLIIGVMAMIGFHVFENIGMTIGVMPCTGIPLPFLSYGGSNMVTNLLAIGLAESVCIRRRYGMFREGDAL
jgi:rod shape determining protein RodA